MGENDITLKDRKKDIYPHNITLCKNNCKYNGINIEEQRVICSCNLNSEKNVDEESEIVEDDGNFITYLLQKLLKMMVILSLIYWIILIIKYSSAINYFLILTT